MSIPKRGDTVKLVRKEYMYLTPGKHPSMIGSENDSAADCLGVAFRGTQLLVLDVLVSNVVDFYKVRVLTNDGRAVWIWGDNLDVVTR